MNIYLFPGLGADKRMYEKQLEVIPAGIVIEHLPSIKGESLAGYARRVSVQIDKSEPFVLMGTSLGGMICLELSRFLDPKKIILIASIKNRSEMPLFIRSMKYLRLHRAISGDGYKGFNNLLVKRVGARGDTEAARLITEMTRDADPDFLEWALDAVVNWDSSGIDTSNVIHVHGTADQLFNYSLINNAIPVSNGSHIMNIIKSSEVNRILLKELKLIGAI